MIDGRLTSGESATVGIWPVKTPACDYGENGSVSGREKEKEDIE